VRGRRGWEEDKKKDKIMPFLSLNRKDLR